MLQGAIKNNIHLQDHLRSFVLDYIGTLVSFQVVKINVIWYNKVKKLFFENTFNKQYDIMKLYMTNTNDP